MQEAVGGHHGGLVDGAPAGEVGDHASRLLDEDERRGQVPGVHADLDHRLGGALSHESVTPEVAEAAVAPGAGEQAAEAGRPGLDVGGRAVHELRVGEGGHTRDVDAPLLPRPQPGPAHGPGAAAAPGQPALAQRGGADDADLHLAVALDAE